MVKEFADHLSGFEDTSEGNIFTYGLNLPFWGLAVVNEIRKLYKCAYEGSPKRTQNTKNWKKIFSILNVFIKLDTLFLVMFNMFDTLLMVRIVENGHKIGKFHLYPGKLFYNRSPIGSKLLINWHRTKRRFNRCYNKCTFTARIVQRISNQF